MAVLGLGNPRRRLEDIGFRHAADLGSVRHRQLTFLLGHLEGAKRCRELRVLELCGVTLERGLGDEVFVGPALLGDVRKDRVEQGEVGTGVDRKVQDIVFASFDLCRVDRNSSARVDEDDLRTVPHPRNHVIEKQVGLRFERVGTDDHNRVGEPIVRVGVIELIDAHVAAGVHLGIVGRAVVDPAVLHLHRLEVELAGAPGVFIAAGRAAMVEHRDEQVVLVVLVDHARRDSGDQVEGVVPACRLPRAVPPDQWLV